MMRRHRAEPRYIHRAAIHFVKLVLYEPFRYAEQWAFRGQKRELDTPPVFILGYYRSGTTHLQEVLLRDQRFGYMNFYEGFFPTAFNSTESWVKPVFEVIIRATGFKHPAHGIPFSFSLPAEEDVAMVFSASRLAANWGQVFTKGFREIYGKTGLLKDITPDETEEFSTRLADLIWRVGKRNPGKRLLLKSPPHTGRVKLLRQMYPNARFIFIRRDPYDVFGSNKKLWKSFEDNWLQAVTPEEVRENILWSHHESHVAYERDKQGLAPNQLCEVTFEDFMAGPLDTIEQIYGQLELGAFASVEQEFEDYLATNHKSFQAPYALTDVELAAVREKLGPWLSAWGYPIRLPRAA